MSRYIFVALVLLFAGQVHAECRSNRDLEGAGFVIHDSARFQEISQDKIDDLKSDTAGFIYDTGARWDDSVVRRPLKAESYDNINTPQSEMYGDLFVISDLETGAAVEVRWYDGRKNVVYDSKVQDCANIKFFPWAVNALF